MQGIELNDTDLSATASLPCVKTQLEVRVDTRPVSGLIRTWLIAFPSSSVFLKCCASRDDNSGGAHNPHVPQYIPVAALRPHCPDGRSLLLKHTLLTVAKNKI